MRVLCGLGCCLVWAGASAAAAAAEPGRQRSVAVEGDVAVVSDYRFRGLSQSARAPALQGSVEVAHASGLYAGTFVSTIADYVVDGAEPEIDLYAGVRASPDRTELTGGLIYYIYAAPAGASGNYFEAFASAARTMGAVTARAATSLSWRQRTLGLDPGEARAGLYVSVDVSAAIPHTALSATAAVGRTFLANASTFGARYDDWSLGGAIDRGPLRLSLTYVDTDTTLRLAPSGRGRGRDIAGAGIVAAATLRF